jgi:hypothetical protein
MRRRKAGPMEHTAQLTDLLKVGEPVAPLVRFFLCTYASAIADSCLRSSKAEPYHSYCAGRPSFFCLGTWWG